MAPRQTGQRDIPTHLSYPLSPSQVEALDAMLVELYRGIGKIRVDQIVAGSAALTRINDTNLTLTLGGSPTAALLAAVELMLGWQGVLAVTRGGLGIGTLEANGVLYGNGTSAVQALAVNAAATRKFLKQLSSAAPVWDTLLAADIPASALTRVNDENVTLTLGGTPATSLLAAASLTLGWTGALKPSRGGVSAATVVLVDGATPALDASLGTVFRLVALGDRTIAVPTNPTPGQTITVQHLASGGARTLALNTGAGGFRFGSDIPALTATASGKTDYISAIYNDTDSRWDVVRVTKGF